MKRILARSRMSWLAAAGVAGLTALILARAVADAKRPAQQQQYHPVNVNIVQPVPANALPIRDFGKSAIELSTEQLLALQTLPASVPAAGAFVNPKVEPGKVRWHKDFAAACAAAQKSGKPVLLFQMMGKLDERFC
jgi:hypothetical protein